MLILMGGKNLIDLDLTVIFSIPIFFKTASNSMSLSSLNFKIPQMCSHRMLKTFKPH